MTVASGEFRDDAAPGAGHVAGESVAASCRHDFVVLGCVSTVIVYLC